MTPGSNEAILKGCKCPVIDNAYGKGYLGGVKSKSGETIYVTNSECPLHGGVDINAECPLHGEAPDTPR